MKLSVWNLLRLMKSTNWLNSMGLAFIPSCSALQAPSQHISATYIKHSQGNMKRKFDFPSSYHVGKYIKKETPWVNQMKTEVQCKNTDKQTLHNRFRREKYNSKF